MMKHPMQNIEHGRFVKNKIVEYLLDNGGIDMNQLAVLDFSDEDSEQFAQLIGYSVSGYQSLSYVSDESAEQADKFANGDNTWGDARVEALETILYEIRKHLRNTACAAFAVHPDDLKSTPG
jgi:hypothetical protein